MEKDISKIIDFAKVDALLEGFNKTTGFVTAILDLNGKVLSKSGWRQVCTDFHRVNSDTAINCKISDTQLAGRVMDGEKYHFYECLNGLVDVAVPILIKGEHIANLFSGQFFFEKPDLEKFRKQAQKYRFNELSYLEAIEKVPVVSKKQVKVAMDFLFDMLQLISELEIQKIEQAELSNTLNESSDLFRAVFESSNVGKSITQTSGEINVNETFSKMLGYTQAELQNTRWQEITPAEEVEQIQKMLDPLIKGVQDSTRFEKRYICKDGSFIWADVSVSILRATEKYSSYFITNVIDITEKKQQETELRLSEELFSNAFQIGPAGMTITSIADGRFMDVNISFLNIFGFTREEVLGHSSVELNMWSQSERKRVIQQQMETGGLHNFEMIARSKTGRPIHILLSSHPLNYMGLPCHITTMIDITDRKMAEAGLQKSEERLRLSTELANVAVWEYDFMANNMTRSQNHDKLYGLDWQEIWDLQTFTEATHPDDREFSNEIIRKSVVPGGPNEYSFDFRVLKPDKSVSWLNVVGQVIQRNEKGEGLIVRGCLIDITERKEAEDHLLKSEYRFKLLFEHATFGVVIQKLIRDEKGIPVDYLHLQVNEALFRHVGIRPEDVLGKLGSEVISKEETAFLVQKFSNVVQTGEPFEFQQYLPTFDKTIDMQAVHIENDYYSVVFFDVTERIKAEEKIGEYQKNLESLLEARTRELKELNETQKSLRESEIKFRSLFEQASVGVAIIDTETGHYLMVNEKQCEITGYSKEEIVETSFMMITHPDDIEEDLKNMEKLKAGEINTFVMEKRYYHKNGTIVWVMLNVAPLWLKGEPQRYHVAIIEDITERKKVELELQHLNAELENRVFERTQQLELANHELESFSYSVSHDLRAPLRHINGYIDLLNKNFENQLPEKAQYYLSVVADSSKQMGQLIDELLRFSKTSRQELKKEKFDMNVLLNEVIFAVQPEITNRKINLKMKHLPYVYGDFSLLKQVWINLLDNALKYTRRKDEVIIDIGFRDVENNFVFYMQDNGVGFDTRYAGKLFGVFQRLHSAAEFEGTGIGLASVQRIIAKHAGNVWAEAEIDKGATFFFTIPKK